MQSSRTAAAVPTDPDEVKRGWRRSHLAAALAQAQFRGVLERPIVEEAAQVLGQVFGPLVALGRVRRQALAGDALQAPGHVRPLLAQRRYGAAAFQGHRLDQRRQRRVAGALVERASRRPASRTAPCPASRCRPAGPPAGPGPGRAPPGAQVLRRHVGHRAADRGAGRLVVQVLGEVEVEQQRLAVAVDEDVARLDVAVQHAAVVGVLQALRQPGDDPGGGAVKSPARKNCRLQIADCRFVRAICNLQSAICNLQF